MVLSHCIKSITDQSRLAARTYQSSTSAEIAAYVLPRFVAVSLAAAVTTQQQNLPFRKRLSLVLSYCHPNFDVSLTSMLVPRPTKYDPLIYAA